MGVYAHASERSAVQGDDVVVSQSAVSCLRRSRSLHNLLACLLSVNPTSSLAIVLRFDFNACCAAKGRATWVRTDLGPARIITNARCQRCCRTCGRRWACPSCPSPSSSSRLTATRESLPLITHSAIKQSRSATARTTLSLSCGSLRRARSSMLTSRWSVRWIWALFTLPTVRNTCVEPIYARNDHFTKTGSGRS